MQISSARTSLAAWVGVFLIGASEAFGGDLIAKLDSTVGQDFQAKGDDAVFSKINWAKNNTNVKLSVLTIDVTFKNNNSITLFFDQTGDFDKQAGGIFGAATDGLNFRMNETIHYKPDDPKAGAWKSFTETLVEVGDSAKVPEKYMKGDHPEYAHFHYPGTDSNPLKPVTKEYKDFVMGKGEVAPGNDLTVSMLQIHEIMVGNDASKDQYVRHFKLVLTPSFAAVPEPSGLTLVCLGISGLGLFHWSRSRLPRCSRE
jgi:hypothetical protein